MSEPVRVRFAPSPTGPLHIGGVRTALYNYFFARKHQGTLILRIEDTDQSRYVAKAEEYILESLKWLGMDFDEGPHIGGPHAPYRQSERKASYRQYADQLVEAGHAYYAFDTSEELDEMRERLSKSGKQAPGYNYLTREHMKNSLALPQDEVQERLERGDEYVIRIKMPRKEDIRFEDEVRGWVVVNSSQLDDKVLLKSDGMPTYHLANIVDDHLMGITHVIRGEEWLPSTPLHAYMYQCFGWRAPKFAHLPLLLNPDGKGKLSKRHGDKYGFPVFPLEWEKVNDEGETEILSGFKESGYMPEALLNFLALLGWHPSGDEELLSMEQLISAFDLNRVSKSGAKFDKNKLIHFNQHYIRESENTLYIEMLKNHLQAEGSDIPGDDKLSELVDMLKERVEVLPDFFTESVYFFHAPQSYDEDYAKKRWKAEFVPALKAANAALAKLDTWEPDTIKQAVYDAAEANGAKFGKLMPMLRLAVTGTGAGPGVMDIMAWLGQQECHVRIAAAVERL
ncbi:MAG: glutamate--tRNA ligase [Bacteroidota bacterium]